MMPDALTQDQRKGIKASIFVIMLVLLLFATVLVAGQPIHDFGTEAPSLAYVTAIYIPVMILCFFAYRRVGRR